MGRYNLCIIHLLFIFIFVNLNCCFTKSIVHVGVVLDLDSSLGSMADLCMKMAIQDFYLAYPNYTTRLQLHTKNAKSLLDANFAVIDLLKHEQVDGILGPQKHTENEFVAELGEKVHVPIISFTARSSTLPFEDNRYSVRTTVDDGEQAQALASICLKFEWSEVVFLYEETDYGNQFLSYLNKALQDNDIGLAYTVSIPIWATDNRLSETLRKLPRKQARVFLVHMNPSLGYRLFTLAKLVGIVSEGYAWIVSDSLSNFFGSIDYVTRDSMEGVLGVRPYVNRSKELENFKERYKRNALLKNSTGPIMELNVYGLWAYDAVTALAIAAENINPLNATSLDEIGNRTNNMNLRVSRFGPKLLTELSRTKFRGVTGDFELVDGKLKQSIFEIFNVHGTGEKTIGFWTAEMGITGELSLSGDGTYSKSTELKNIVWPGDSLTRPKGWAIPTTGNLIVGVPWKHGFKEFVNVKIDNVTHKTNATGFAIDIFLEALKLLPFSVNHEFHHYNDSENPDWSYDDMLNQIPKKFDMVVGDTTIWAPRTKHIDFSLPYSESGVILVVKNKKPFDMWTFTRPLRWDLWLAIIMACILMGIVLRVLEHRVAGEDPTSSPMVKPGNIYLSPVAVLAFPERNMVSNNWSFLVLVFWLFMAFILMQSYTANLSAILTVDRLKFAFSDNYYIGFQEGSFMKQFLTQKLHISESRLRSYSSAEEYHKAMSLGSKKGGIDAIFDEIPYMKFFLNKYDSYKMVGPTYRTGGFGFAFLAGSPLVSHFSKAIVDVTQGPNMTSIEQANFGPGYSSLDPLSSTISQGASGLKASDFAGLFLIIGSVTVFSLFCSKTPFGRKLTENVRQFLEIRLCFTRSGVTPVDVTSTSVGGDSAGAGSVEMQESRQKNVSSVIVEEGTNANVTGPAQEHVSGQAQLHVSGHAEEFNSVDVDHETRLIKETTNQDLGSGFDNNVVRTL